MYKVIGSKDYHDIKIVKEKKNILNHDSFRRYLKRYRPKVAMEKIFQKYANMPKIVMMLFIIRILRMREKRALDRVKKGKMDNKTHVFERRLLKRAYRAVINLK